MLIETRRGLRGFFPWKFDLVIIYIIIGANYLRGWKAQSNNNIHCVV